jgi:hypothetical protein
VQQWIGPYRGMSQVHRTVFGGTEMQKIEVQLEDDLTGGPADETVTFGVDGRVFEIDLNAKHAASLRQQLARFVERARQVHQRSRTTARTTASRERSRSIRAWAEEQGFDVAGHGRLPASVIQEYDLAQSGAQQAGQQARARSAQRTSRAPRRNAARHP